MRSPAHFKKRAIPASTRRAVALAAGATPGTSTPIPCTYCGAMGEVWWPRTLKGTPGGWVTLSGLEFDHVIAEYHGGSSEPDNIVLACRPCNRSKGHR